MTKKLILIKNFQNRLFAEMAQQTLDAEDISSIVKAPDYGITVSGTSGGFGIFTGQGVDLYVEEEFAEKAEEIAREL
ncbi:MAG: DUF2007 domain-containing protein [Bacteroidota bacterium]|nr:DUF2007 domain-containing protein [Bacteroidota bacterium]